MARCRFTLNTCIAGYHGIAESVYWERRRGMVVMAVLLVLSLVQAFVAMGGTNGFGTYGTDRMAAARSLYDHTVGRVVLVCGRPGSPFVHGPFLPSTRGLGIVGYWSAMIAIESIVWLGVAAWGGYTFFKLLQVRACDADTIGCAGSLTSALCKHQHVHSTDAATICHGAATPPHACEV